MIAWDRSPPPARPTDRGCPASDPPSRRRAQAQRHHTFAQFGAGLLSPSRPRTYLGPNVVIDPPALQREAAHLAELGVEEPASLITIHPRCLVTTIWHRLLNQLRELSRGTQRHGSCGQGIGETRSYWLRHGADAIFACLGPALEIFSRYSRVEKASGEQVTLKEYLEYVWAAVAKEALNMIFEGADATGFEEDARLTAMWLWTLGDGKTIHPRDKEDTEEDTEESDEEESWPQGRSQGRPQKGNEEGPYGRSQKGPSQEVA